MQMSLGVLSPNLSSLRYVKLTLQTNTFTNYKLFTGFCEMTFDLVIKTEC